MEQESKLYFKVQVCSDLTHWRDCESIYPDLPSAEYAAADIASRSMWTSARVVRVEESVCNEYLGFTHSYIQSFK